MTTAVRLSVGIDKVIGSLGFTEKGWNIGVHQDLNSKSLCFVSARTSKDGTIYVKASNRRFDDDEAAIVAGGLMDTQDGGIEFRLKMPSNVILVVGMVDFCQHIDTTPQSNAKTTYLIRSNWLVVRIWLLV